MWNKKILTQTIKENLAKGNFEAVENACRIAFEKGGLTQSEKDFIKIGFIKVIEDYQKKRELDSIIIISEFLKTLDPSNIEYVLYQFEAIETIFNDTKNDLTHHDCQMLNLILSALIDPYKSVENLSSALPAIALESKLEKKINEKLPQAPKKEESQVTYRLEMILETIASVKFSHLTPEERVKEASKYLGKGLRRVLRKINEGKQDKTSK
jgi:hypothetical protein